MGDDLGLLVMQYHSIGMMNTELFYSTFDIKGGEGYCLRLKEGYRGSSQQHLNPNRGHEYDVSAGPYCVIRLLARCLEYIVPAGADRGFVDEKAENADRTFHDRYLDLCSNYGIQVDQLYSIFRDFDQKHEYFYKGIAEFFSSELSNKLQFIFLIRPSLPDSALDYNSLDAFGFKWYEIRMYNDLRGQPRSAPSP